MQFLFLSVEDPKNYQHITLIFTEIFGWEAYEEKASVFSGTVFTGVSSFPIENYMIWLN